MYVYKSKFLSLCHPEDIKVASYQANYKFPQKCSDFAISTQVVIFLHVSNIFVVDGWIVCMCIMVCVLGWVNGIYFKKKTTIIEFSTAIKRIVIGFSWSS